LAGATAVRGRIGYGGKRHPSPSHLVLSQDRPIVVEVVDGRDTLDAYVTAIDPMVPAGLITVETIEVVRYGRGS
jgi:PII-like signaling protein